MSNILVDFYEAKMGDVALSPNEIEKLEAQIVAEKNEQLAQIKKELSVDAKRKAVESDQWQQKYEKLLQTREAELAAKNFDFFKISKEKLQKIKTEARDFHAAAKNKLPFITPKLSSIVPNHAGNLILIGAKTNAGKSTTAANIAAEIIKDKTKKVLIISGEEMAGDVYKRISCIEKGWNYASFSEFSEEQMNYLDRRLDELAEQVVVLDSASEIPALTTSVEGLDFITSGLKEAAAKGQVFDAIMIDYFQKISSSTKHHDASVYSVLEQVTNKLDLFKNHYRAPIIVFAQLKPETKDAEFEERIKFCRNILVVATFAIEAKVNYENRTTDFVPVKARYGAEKVLNVPVTLHYRMGKFEDITPQTDPANANFKPLNF